MREKYERKRKNFFFQAKKKKNKFVSRSNYCFQANVLGFFLSRIKEKVMMGSFFFQLSILFYFILFYFLETNSFTVLYWFCHTLT